MADTNLGTLKAIITADTAGFDAGVKKAQGTLGKLDSGVQRVSSTMSKVWLGAMGAGSIAAIKLASDVEETRAKLHTVFGDLSGDAMAWAEETAGATNRSKYALEGYLATLQDTFKPLGFAAQASSDMSKQVTQLAVDLASFNNLNTDDVVRDLQSALVGNTETLRKYGVVANQAAIEQEAIAMGLDFVKGKMDAQTEAAAVLSLTLKGTADAQGDAARTSGSFANQLRGVTAKAEELAVKLGTVLLPVATDALEKISSGFDIFYWAVQKVVQGVSGLIINFEFLANIVTGMPYAQALEEWKVSTEGWKSAIDLSNQELAKTLGIVGDVGSTGAANIRKFNGAVAETATSARQLENSLRYIRDSATGEEYLQQFPEIDENLLADRQTGITANVPLDQLYGSTERASGGPLNGRVTKINELGTEGIAVGGQGNVIPAGQMRRMGGGLVFAPTVNLNGGATRQDGEMIIAALERAANSNRFRNLVARAAA